jgi:hypothetical protein
MRMTLQDTPLPTGPPAAPAAAPGPQRPPSSKGVSMRLAMIVPALGLLILAVFITTEFLTSNPTSPQAKVPSTFVASGLHAVAGASALKPIIVSGQPPDNIVAAVSVPEASVAVSTQNNTQAAEQYDAQVTLRVDATQGTLQRFFLTAMKRQGWQIIDQGPASHNPGAIQVLGKLAGTDGYYWEMGAVIAATTFPAGAPPTGATAYTVRILQMPDPD